MMNCYWERIGESRETGKEAMNELLIAGISLASTGLLLLARSLVFRGRPSIHERVHTIDFENAAPNSAHVKRFESKSPEEWPSLIDDEKEPALAAIEGEKQLITLMNTRILIQVNKNTRRRRSSEVSNW